jgi:hypothetical protein
MHCMLVSMVVAGAVLGCIYSCLLRANVATYACISPCVAQSVLHYCVLPADAEARVVQLEQQLAAARHRATGLMGGYMGPGMLPLSDAEMLRISILSPQEHS